MRIEELSFLPDTCCEAAGYPAWDVRELLPGLNQCCQVIFTSRDMEAVAVSGEEILEGGVYLGVSGGAPEGTGSSSAFRLIIPKDSHKRRWCKDIVEIKTEEGDG